MATENNSDNNASSPVTYGQVIANGQSTMTLAASIFTYVSQPIANYLSDVASRAEFRRRLGDWASEAIDKDGRWLQPVLRTAALRDHLIQESACPLPPGRCTSSYGWAQLLYALNICPGMDIVSWRLPTKPLQPGTNEISLVIDGEALCHIINLFRSYDNPTPLNFSYNRMAGAASSRTRDVVDPHLRRGYNSCIFPFGTLQVDRQWSSQPRDMKIRATFEPGSQQDLSRKKVPFAEHYSDGEVLRMKFEVPPAVFMAKYFAGMKNLTPITDDRSIGLVPSHQAPLSERAQYFLKSIQLLSSYDDERRKIDLSKPRLITYQWLESIARIKRHVTTDGGENRWLLEHLVRLVLQHPELIALAETFPGQQLATPVESILRRLFLFTHDHISIRQLDLMSASSEAMPHRFLVEPVGTALGDVIADLDTAAQQVSFANLASVSNGKILAILQAPQVFTNVPVFILELGQDHIFWKSVFEIE